MGVITEVWFDYYHGAAGEAYTCRKLGDNLELGIVLEITEHRPQGEGDKWYYDIMYDGGQTERTFAPHRVFYE